MEETPQLDPNLHPWGIIVTRPKAQATSLLERIKAHNGQSFWLPLLEISFPHNKKGARHIISKSTQNDYYLFTSPNAVLYAKKLGFSFPREKQYIALGKGTERHLKEEGVSQKYLLTGPKPYTSEALLTFLKAYPLNEQSILIFSGEGGRRLLGEGLQAQGAKTKYVDVYRRVRPVNLDLSPIVTYANEHPVLLTITSEEAFQTLLPFLKKEALLDKLSTIIVGSERLAAVVKKTGFSHPLVAASALEDDLWQAITQYVTNDLQPQYNGKDSPKKLDDSSTPLSPSSTPSTQISKDNEAAMQKDSKDEKKDIKNKNVNQDEEITPPVPESTLHNNTSPHSEPPPLKEESQSKIGWVAAFIALISLGISSYLYFTPNSKEAATLDASAHFDSEAFESTLTETQEELSLLKTELTKLATSKESTTEDIFDTTLFTNLTEQVDTTDEKLNQLSETLETLLLSQNQDNETLEKLSFALENLQNEQNQLTTTMDEQKIVLAAMSDDSTDILTELHKLQTDLAQNKIKGESTLIEARNLINTIKNTTDLAIFKVAEIDYLLTFAKYKLTFEKDTQGAIDILETAKLRMEESELPFRVTLNYLEEALTELEAYQTKNQSQATIGEKLFDITLLINEAPLKEEGAMATLRDKIYQTQQTIEQDKKWYKNLLSSLFFVEEERIEPPKLMSEYDGLFIKQNIQTQLSAARLALLQNMPTLFQDSLTLARSWIDDHLDPRSEIVAQALAEIEVMLEHDWSTALPDITSIIFAFKSTLEARKDLRLETSSPSSPINDSLPTHDPIDDQETDNDDEETKE